MLVASFLGCGPLREAFPCKAPDRPTEIVAADLPGTYAGPGTASVTLRADGTFAIDLVVNTYDGGHVTGSGEWRLRPVDDSRHEASGMARIFDVEVNWPLSDNTYIDNWSPMFNVGGTKAAPLLWFYYQDVDDCDIHKLQRSGRQAG
jgi:hypothetical protein